MRADIAPLALRWPAPLLQAPALPAGPSPMPHVAATAAARTRHRPTYSLGDLCTLAWHARRIWLPAVAIATLLGAGAGWMLQSRPAAVALLLSPGADETVMQSELSILRSDAVLHDVSHQLGAAQIVAAYRRPWPLQLVWRGCAPESGETDPCVAALLRGAISVRLDGERHGEQAGQVLRVSAQSPDPALSIAMADATVTAASARRRAAFLSARADAMAPGLAAAERALAATRQEEAALRAEGGSADIGQDLAAANVAMAALARRDSQIRERQTAVSASLAKARDVLAGTAEQVPYSREDSSRDAAEEQRSTLLRLRLERAHMAELYSADYPGLAELDRKIAVAQRPVPRSTATVTRHRRNPTFDALSGRVASLQVEAEALGGQRAEIARQAAVLAPRVATLGAAANALATLQQRSALQQEIVRKLSLDLTQLRADDAQASAQVADLRVLQPAMTVSGPGGPGVMGGAALGLVFGLGAGLAGTVAASRRRPVYVVSREVERHLGATIRARFALWRNGAAMPADPPSARGLAAEILDATNVEGGAISAIHLIGTARDDGSEAVAHALVDALSAQCQARVMLLRLRRDGRGDLHSVGPRAQASTGQALRVGMPAGAANAASAANTICALFGDPGGVTGMLREQVAGLRSLHDLVVVISEHGTVPSITRRLSALADVDVMVIRGCASAAQDVADLHACATGAGGRAPGFIFTTASGRSNRRTLVS